MATATAEPESLTATEATALLRISRRSLLRLVNAEKLPGVLAGVGPKAPLRVPRAAVLAFLAGLCPWAAIGLPNPNGPAPRPRDSTPPPGPAPRPEVVPRPEVAPPGGRPRTRDRVTVWLTDGQVKQAVRKRWIGLDAEEVPASVRERCRLAAGRWRKVKAVRRVARASVPKGMERLWCVKTGDYLLAHDPGIIGHFEWSAVRLAAE